MPTPADIRHWDLHHHWHAFTQMAEYEPLVIARADGCRLFDIDGNSYLDGASSMWCNVHGHNHPRINAAIRAQLDRVAHCTALGMGSDVAAHLAKRLADIAPGNLEHVFFASDGSSANEVALKMAFQYWLQCDNPQPQKTRFMALGEAYHGDTLGSASVSGIARFHALFKPLLFDVIRGPLPDPNRVPSQVDAAAGSEEFDQEPSPRSRVGFGSLPSAGRAGEGGTRTLAASTRAASPLPNPPHQGEGIEQFSNATEIRTDASHAASHYLHQIESLLQAHHHELAALVIEPIVQCAAGMVMHPPGFLRGVRELTQKFGVLLIADEVAVGFGRTGTMFACEQEGVVPDFLCLGKGLSGGYLPLAATITNAHIYRAFLGAHHEGRTLHHGHTFSGNPLACAAGLASLDVFKEEQTLANLPPKIARLSDHLCRLAEHPHVLTTRQRGLIGALEPTPDKSTGLPYPAQERRAWRICRETLANGVWLRPLADVLYVMPPLAISLDELDIIMDTLTTAIDKITFGAEI